MNYFSDFSLTMMLISYPNENMLRNSDGVWTTRRIMRVQVTAGDVSELIGQTVTGQSSLATAIPVSTIGVREHSRILLK